jgi:small subunit ribosomal protein S17
MPKKILQGTVVSAKMNKTVIISVELPKRHPIYGKEIKNTRRFKAHTEDQIKEGSIVTIEECRPVSKEVTWKVIEVKA